MSAISDLLRWYADAYERRDGNWAPAELNDAAIEEMIARAADQGSHFTRHDAAVALAAERQSQETRLRERDAQLARAIVAKDVEQPADARRDVDQWTREDFIARVRQDQEQGGSGSKERIARRVFVAPTVLWRRWEHVRKPGERWPSGNKGPADW